MLELKLIASLLLIFMLYMLFMGVCIKRQHNQALQVQKKKVFRYTQRRLSNSGDEEVYDSLISAWIPLNWLSGANLQKARSLLLDDPI